MRNDAPAQKLRAFGTAVLRVAAVAFAVAFLAFYVHRQVAREEAATPILAAGTEKASAQQIASATAALTTWLRAVEPPAAPVVFGSSKRAPVFLPGEEARMKVRSERNATITSLLAPLRAAYLGGSETEVRQALQGVGISVDANQRASISPSNDPTQLNLFKTEAVVEGWNRLAMTPKPVAASLAAANGELGAWLRTVHPGPSVAVVFGGSKSRPAFTPEDAAKIRKHREEQRAEVTRRLLPLYQAYRAGQEEEVRGYLRGMGIIVDANLNAQIAPDMDDPTKINQTNVHGAVEAWNALSQPERERSANLNRDPGRGTQTQLHFSIPTLSNWLRSSGETLTPQLFKERAARVASYLAYPYEHGQEGATIGRLKEFGIIVGEDHRAVVDPAAMGPGVDRLRAQAFADAWNELAPRPRSLIPSARPQAQSTGPTLPPGMSLQALVKEARTQPPPARPPAYLGGSKSMPLQIFPSNDDSPTPGR